MQNISLTDQQNQALKAIIEWYKGDEQVFVLSGYAGSGKTTVAKEISNMISNSYFVAYTGKAASVLREKGLSNAQTIHSFLYKVEGKDEKGDPIFILKDDVTLFGKPLLVVDEYSMLGKPMIDDILGKCSKVLFIGDPAQLPPIKEKKPVLDSDFFLDEIHRQALENPIVRWAHKIRNGKIPKIGVSEPGFEVINKLETRGNRPLLDSVEQIICGQNKTKRSIDLALRDHYGFAEKSEYPVLGDKLICLKNNHDKMIYNGMLFTNKNPSYDHGQYNYRLMVKGQEHLIWCGDVLGKDPREYRYSKQIERFGYAYAITCHKAQGSEFNSVLVYDEAWGPTRLNWLYTAVTRARENCILAL